MLIAVLAQCTNLSISTTSTAIMSLAARLSRSATRLRVLARQARPLTCYTASRFYATAPPGRGAPGAPAAPAAPSESFNEIQVPGGRKPSKLAQVFEVNEINFQTLQTQTELILLFIKPP
jgi:hypothetical protein